MFPFAQDYDSYDHLTDICKIFLSQFNDMDKFLDAESEPKIQLSSSLSNVLLLGETSKRHGILRNYWEGDAKGEVFFLCSETKNQ